MDSVGETEPSRGWSIILDCWCDGGWEKVYLLWRNFGSNFISVQMAGYVSSCHVRLVTCQNIKIFITSICKVQNGSWQTLLMAGKIGGCTYDVDGLSVS